MEKYRQIPWPRILAEGTAIVVSILLAFWIQAWWDETQQRSDESVVLQSLLDDLQEKKVLLERQRRNRQATLESATRLLQAATDRDQTISDDSIDKLLGDLLWFDCVGCWDSAPMNSLISGGNSSLISNVGLLQRLATLQVSISRLKNDLRDNRDFHFNTFTPFLIDKANLAQIATFIEHSPGDPEAIYDFPELKISVAQSHTELLSRADFQSLLFLKIDLYGDLFRPGYLNIKEQLDDVIALLEDELAK